MDAVDFISLAGRLAAAANADGATCRTAVSRSYYGAFHVASAFLAELGFSAPRTANVHAFVQHHLNGSEHPAARTAASLLSDLHTARNRADYQLGQRSVETLAFARLCVATAHEVQAAISACRQTPACDLVRSGIAAYVQRISGRRQQR